MNSWFESHFSLTAVQAELQADPRIQARALEVFGKREVMNSYLAQFVFGLIAIAGYFTGNQSLVFIGLIHCLVDQLVRRNLRILARTLAQGDIDHARLGHIEHIFYGVGFVWAMASWPLAQALDGLRLLLTVVSVAGVLVMANTTCFAPRVFRASVIGFALSMALGNSSLRDILIVLGGATAASFDRCPGRRRGHIPAIDPQVRIRSSATKPASHKRPSRRYSPESGKAVGEMDKMRAAPTASSPSRIDADIRRESLSP